MKIRKIKIWDEGKEPLFVFKNCDKNKLKELWEKIREKLD